MGLRDFLEVQQFTKAMDRNSRALERIGDLLESILPSPLADPKFQSNDLKPKGESTLKVYGEREAFLEERKRLREEAQRDLE